jgi:hypothetical protein
MLILYILLCFLFSLTDGRLYKYLVLEMRIGQFLGLWALVTIVIHFSCCRDVFYGNRINYYAGTFSGLDTNMQFLLRYNWFHYALLTILYITTF